MQADGKGLQGNNCVEKEGDDEEQHVDLPPLEVDNEGEETMNRKRWNVKLLIW